MSTFPHREDKCQNVASLLSFLLFHGFYSKTCACSEEVVPLECLPMLKTCSEGLTYPVTCVVCSYK